MKKLILLHAMLISFTAATVYGMEQESYEQQKTKEEKRSKVLTLKELALQKLHEADITVDPVFQTYPEDYKKLVRDYAQDDMRVKSTRLSSIMPYVQEFYKEKKYEQMLKLIEKIPFGLLDGLMNYNINIKSFLALVDKGSPQVIKEKFTEQFAQEVNNFLKQDSITTVEFTIPIKNPQGKIVSFEAIDLPINFSRIYSEGVDDDILISVPIFPDKLSVENKLEFLVPIFIMQKLQLMLIEALKTKNNEELFILKSKMDNVLSKVEDLIKAYKASSKELYDNLVPYFTKVRDSFIKLSSSEIYSIVFRYFIWDQNYGVHKKDKTKKIYRINEPGIVVFKKI